MRSGKAFQAERIARTKAGKPGTYMAQLTSLSRLGALQAEPARIGHQGAAKWFWKKLGRSWSQRAGNEAPRASEVRIGSEVGDLSISISRG